METSMLNLLLEEIVLLQLIVLSVDPALLYLIGNPEDPVEVWRKLADQFQKKTWANKLELQHKLYSMRLTDGDSVYSHIKAMTEVFNSLSIVGNPISDEDRVVYLLAVFLNHTACL